MFCILTSLVLAQVPAAHAEEYAKVKREHFDARKKAEAALLAAFDDLIKKAQREGNFAKLKNITGYRDGFAADGIILPNGWPELAKEVRAYETTRTGTVALKWLNDRITETTKAGRLQDAEALHHEMLEVQAGKLAPPHRRLWQGDGVRIELHDWWAEPWRSKTRKRWTVDLPGDRKYVITASASVTAEHVILGSPGTTGYIRVGKDSVTFKDAGGAERKVAGRWIEVDPVTGKPEEPKK